MEAPHAALKLREAIRTRVARELEMCEPTERFKRGLPYGTDGDVECAIAYLESLEEEEQAIRAFRESLLPPL